MNEIVFTEPQKQALLDLLVVGMYADHKLTKAEEDCIQRLLDSFELPSTYDRQKAADAAFTRVRPHTASPESIRAYVAQLAGYFPARVAQQSAYRTLETLLTSDGLVTNEENQLLALVREVFGL